MPGQTEGLAHLWRWFGQQQCRGYSPLYERICASVARNQELLELVAEAPPRAHLPASLLGAVHYVLLEGFEHPLADVYAGRSDADPGPLFADVCRVRRDQVAELLATRLVQTNEVGRSALMAPALTWLVERHHRPLALVDVGASAGLNLLCDRYRLDYGDHGASGPVDSPVHVQCLVTAGDPPVAERLPPIVRRVGIDRVPVDLSDPDDVRWLLACVWPGTGRLERTEAAIRLARQQPPELVRGEADAVLGRVLGTLPAEALVVVSTTWAFGYFSLEQRRRFLELLELVSHRRPVAWLSAEILGSVEAFTRGPSPFHHDTTHNVLGSVLFDGGSQQAELLGFVQPHGRWLDWRGPPP